MTVQRAGAPLQRRHNAYACQLVFCRSTCPFTRCDLVEHHVARSEFAKVHRLLSVCSLDVPRGKVHELVTGRTLVDKFGYGRV